MRCFVLAILLVLGAVLVPAAAHADDREEARREFANGQAADRRKEYEVAIEHYLRANDLVPHPFAMFNIATDFERLGKLREAATWYERYLDSASPTEADREKVNRLLIELRNRSAPITVNSRPDGARVVINGIPTGSTPYKGQLKGGMYRVAVERDGQRDYKEVTIEYGEPAALEFTLRGATREPAPAVRRPAPAPGAVTGTLYVTGAPIGAVIAVDGMAAGIVPARIPIEPGEHAVRVTAYGYTAFETTVQVTADAETPVTAALVRDGATTMGTHPKLNAGYLVGGGGGMDARGAGGNVFAELGFRVAQYDFGVRAGRVSDATAVDLLIRWALTRTRVAPYFAAGYGYISGGFGYVAFGGLRWDITRGDRVGLSLMAEGGVRFFSKAATTDGDGNPVASTSGTMVPIIASLLVQYR